MVVEKHRCWLFDGFRRLSIHWWALVEKKTLTHGTTITWSLLHVGHATLQAIKLILLLPHLTHDFQPTSLDPLAVCQTSYVPTIWKQNLKRYTKNYAIGQDPLIKPPRLKEGLFGNPK